MAEKSDSEEVVCEFFGIQITTKNPKVARVLQTDMGEFMSQDIRDIGGRRTVSSASDDNSDAAETDGLEADLDLEAETSDDRVD